MTTEEQDPMTTPTPPEAAYAAAKALREIEDSPEYVEMTTEDMALAIIEAAAPEIQAAVRAKLAAVISPDRFRELAGWLDDDDALKMTLAADPLMIVPRTWRDRSNEWQADLRQFADLLSGDK